MLRCFNKLNRKGLVLNNSERSINSETLLYKKGKVKAFSWQPQLTGEFMLILYKNSFTMADNVPKYTQKINK